MTALSVAADFAMGQTAGFAARHWREHEALAAMRVIESAASAAPDFPQTPHAPTARANRLSLQRVCGARTGCGLSQRSSAFKPGTWPVSGADTGHAAELLAKARSA